MTDLLTPDFKSQPYWWDAAPPVPAPEPALDPSYDVAIVGAGIFALPQNIASVASPGAALIGWSLWVRGA